MSKGNRLEIEQHLHFYACRRDCSLPCALAAPCLLIRRDWGSDQLQTVFLSFPPAPSTFRSSFLSRSLEPRSTTLLVCRRKATSLAPSVFYLLETSLGSAVWRMAPCVPTGRRREGLLPSCQGRGRTHSMAGAHCLRYKPCLSTEAKGSGLAASRS